MRVATANIVQGVLTWVRDSDPNYSLYLQKVAEIAPDRNLPKDEFDRRMALMSEALGDFEIVLKPDTERVFDFLQEVGKRIREVPPQLLAFFADRLKVQQREAGVRHDLIDAVFALGGEDDLVRLLARVHALQAFVGTEDGANLLAGYKRAANILKKEGWPSSPLPLGEGQGAEGSHESNTFMGAPSAPRGEGEGDTPATDHPHPSAATPLPPSPAERGISLSYTPEPAEAALIAALDAAEPAAADAVRAEDFEAAMAALATLRAPIDAFFDSVTVNDPAANKRAARLALLARVRAAVHNVADFSKIEG